MTTISTNLRNTLESARRTRYDPSSVNTATNVQDAINNMLAGLPASTTVVATGAIAVTDINVQTNQAAPITLTLPNSVAWAAASGKYGLPLSIFDISGNAETNTVTINPAGGQTISGLAALTIAVSYTGFRLEPKFGGGWIVV